jgi:hypothetical protein
VSVGEQGGTKDYQALGLESLVMVFLHVARMTWGGMSCLYFVLGAVGPDGISAVDLFESG